MIPVSDELKQAVIHEVMPKTMKIGFGDTGVGKLNWYSEEPNSATEYNLHIAGNGEMELTSTGIFDKDKMVFSHLNLSDYLIFSFEIRLLINPNSLPANDTFGIRVSFQRSNGSYYIADSQAYNYSHIIPPDIYSPTFIPRVFVAIPIETSSGTFVKFDKIWFRNFSSQAIYTGGNFYNQQLSLQDEVYLPEYTDIYATNENIEKYVRVELDDIENDNIISQSFSYKESICSAETLKFGLSEASEIQIDVFDKNYDYTGRRMDVSLKFGNVQQKFEWKNFVIAEAKKSYVGNTQKRHIVAYDKLKNLSENAYAWYTQYMWGINMDSEYPQTTYSFDYVRQIFSTFYNLAKSFGIESDIEKEMLDVVYPNDCPTNDRYFDYDPTDRVKFCKHTVTVDNKYDGYMIYIDKNPITTQYPDPLFRGFRNANICIDFHTDTDTYQQLFDPEDVFAIPDGCTTFDVYLPYVFNDLNTGLDGMKFVNDFIVYGVTFNSNNSPKTLVNGFRDLPYFSFVFRNPTVENIFKADSSITARDVMRSLMEICGCFFRLDREGKPQFLYAMEHGLYPSNTLFPADDLFPKKSSEMTMPTSYYIKADFEEYRVSNFGGVQVVVNDFNNNGTVCRWEYWGDDSSDNAYLIDDNIFLCSSQFEYEPEMAGNIETLLENLWGVLNNMSYTPFTAECIGTPFLESGDRFTLLTKNDGFESFIFERTLKGIQALKDTYEARGKNTPRVKTFEWNERS